jgi:hypothetical protein
MFAPTQVLRKRDASVEKLADPTPALLRELGGDTPAGGYKPYADTSWIFLAGDTFNQDRFTFAHEFGHIQGLCHQDDPRMLMYAFQPFHISDSLDATECSTVNVSPYNH